MLSQVTLEFAVWSGSSADSSVRLDTQRMVLRTPQQASDRAGTAQTFVDSVG